MKHFVLSGSEQLHDLHTKLVLDHPQGVADQLHKCIVAHSTGRGVFDGNVQVGQHWMGLAHSDVSICMHTVVLQLQVYVAVCESGTH